MDSPKITHISLCSGYGGIDLGLKGVFGQNVRTVAYAEIEAFAIECLLARMGGGQLDAAPIWPNLKTFPWGAFSDRVDILSGGYPCQPFSAAGKRLGTDDPRHLWPFIADGIRLLRPKCCFFENVEGHISLGLRAVIEELGSIGYKTTWGIFSAREVGAPHQRKRVFILAHHNSERGQEFARRVSAQSNTHPPRDVCATLANSSSQRSPAGISEQESRHEREPGEPYHSGHQAGWPSRPGEQQYVWEPPRVMADSHRIDRSAPAEGREHDRQAGSAGEELGNAGYQRQEERQLPTGWFEQSDQNMADASISRCNGRPDGISGRSRESGEACEDAAGCGGESNGMRQAQPALGRDANGSASGMDYAKLCVSCDNRTDELRLLGNGVVPATATIAFLTLIKQLNE